MNAATQSQERPLACVIMAGGKGTRMHSDLPKVLHRVWGRTLIGWVLEAVRSSGIERIVVVAPPAFVDEVAAVSGSTQVVAQPEQRGTGDAVACGMGPLADHDGDVLVVSGDTPLLTAETLSALVAEHRSVHATATLATFEMEDAGMYGRVLRGSDGSVRIVEARDATTAELEVGEVNAGLYVIAASALRPALATLSTDNAASEQYLPDVLPTIAADGGVLHAALLDDPMALHGVNTRVELAEAATVLRERILTRHMLAGVGIVDPATTYIDADARIEPDAVIHPFTIIRGATQIETRAEIGPHSVLTDATVETGANAGPFAHLRPGSVLRADSRVGAFSETKNTVVGRGSKIPHLSYVGDAEIGEDSNIGAGNITANFDGREKHRTVIGDRVRTGSDCVFVAPVTIGDDVTTGAGSIITDDVPPGSLAIARARQVNKERYVEGKRDE
jgi:bifunctional UDP-N-acetylglucosamine pyrophosphorylase/glucosamine-1-phosphate N-acetyltransferase